LVKRIMVKHMIILMVIKQQWLVKRIKMLMVIRHMIMIRLKFMVRLNQLVSELLIW